MDSKPRTTADLISEAEGKIRELRVALDNAVDTPQEAPVRETLQALEGALRDLKELSPRGALQTGGASSPS